MSYFKPLNSNENNLHIIRASIDNTGNITKPSINQLPPTFTASRYIDLTGNTANCITINYPSIYNSSDIPSVFVESQTSSFMYVSNKTSISANISSSNGILSNVDIAVIGTKSSGPVFAVSNRGWKYSTSQTNDNLIYSDMLVGINTDNPTFNLTTAGNICFIPNKVSNGSINNLNLLNSYINIIDIDTASNTSISLPTSINDGQLLNIIVGNITTQNINTITLDTSSNIINRISNITLQNSGDTISLCSYQNSWLITNVYTKPPSIPIINYNQLNSSNYNFNNINNGLLTIVNLDANLSISLPTASTYNGYVIEMVIGNIANIANNNSVTLLSTNIISRNSNIILSNISDKIKLLGTINGWLII